MTTTNDSIILQLEERLRQAQLAADVNALDELIADDLLFTAMDGSIATKSMDLEMHRSGALKVLKMDFTNIQIRHLPNGSAAVTRVTANSAATVQGQRVEARLIYTRVWTNRGGRWQIQAGHMSLG